LLGERFKWEKDIDSCFDQIVWCWDYYIPITGFCVCESRDRHCDAVQVNSQRINTYLFTGW
jgi:hypothetical protein